MVTSGRCPILKNLSVGGWSHPRLWIVWWKKKRFSQKICVLGDGQACVRAESQIEVDAHPRSVTCTHTHTQNPLTVPGYCLRPTRHQPNETYLWQEHAAPALLHTGTSWILAADTHTRTYSHSGRREADGKMKTGRKDAVVSFSPLPHWVLSHLVTRRLALCPMLWPRSPHSSSFSYPAANTSLVSPSLFLPQSTRDCTPFLSLGLQVVSLSNPRESFLFPTACSSISSSLTESCSFTSCTFHLWLWPAVLCCRNSQKDIVRLGWGCTDTHTLTPGSYSALLKLRLSCPARNVLPWLGVVCTTANSSFKFLGNSSCIT